MAVIEHRDEIIIGSMAELAQSSGWKIICEDLKRIHTGKYMELLEVRKDQDKPVYTEDQLLKKQLYYLEYLWNLPNTLVKTTTTYTQDMSKSL